MVEHIRSTVPSGQVLSICDEASEQVTVTAVQRPRVRYAMVVNAESGRQHRVATASSAAEDTMVCQATVQWLEEAQVPQREPRARFCGTP